jgi:NAD(P)-dependent dehydrogenase (short-subunit alcohol dehydrogenase family)
MVDTALSVVVTGATGQLGQAVTAKLLAVEGTQVLAISRKGIRLLTASSHADVAAGVDLTSISDIESMRQVVAETFKGRFSIINCIGHFPGYKPFLEVAPVEAEKVFRANFLSVYFVALGLVPLITARGGGDFVCFSTLSSAEAYPLMAAFDSAKAALEQLTRHLANEFGGDGLRANALALATLKTSEEMRLKPSGDHEHWIDPSEVAEMVRDLVMGQFRLVNGNVLRCYHYSDRFYRTSYFERVQRGPQ